MDFEAPVDAWYVWIGAAFVSVAMFGVVASLPQQPPPDAMGAANTVDAVAGASMGGEATHEHDAEEVRISQVQISMRNDGGTAHGTVSYGRMAPVNGSDDLEAVLYGGHPSEEYSDPDWQSAFHDDVVDARQNASDPEWRPASGTLRVKAVVYRHNGNETTGVLVDV